jgi:hypothetical protein
MNEIYMVTVVHPEEKRKRTWGWYAEFKDAETAVLENHTDIFELGYYSHAVIEKFPEGVMAISDEEWCGDDAFDLGFNPKLEGEFERGAGAVRPDM